MSDTFPAPLTAFKPVRIFWFGAHKLLVHTELARLRTLGYEVFNPPYLSHVRDQSAVTAWDRQQPTTLPPDVFETLSGCNFFYNAITPDIAEILNAYFDAVIVTLVARWTTEILRVFEGPVLFRTYGQTSLLSDDLQQRGADRLIRARDNFHFLPHSAETGDVEEPWLQRYMTVIPYCLNQDVFDSRDTWTGDGIEGEVLITAPNILGNIFHQRHYDFLKEYFHQPYFRFLGVQLLGRMEDPQVIGTMSRHDQLALFRRAAGYLYTYRDPRVCYLPPTEMMVFGGPVIYLSGSLLARYIGAGGPGEAATISAAHDKCARLRQHDHAFINEVRASQRGVVDRYDPALVWPAFDRAMTGLLPSASTLPTNTPLFPFMFPEISPRWQGVRVATHELLTRLASEAEHVSLGTAASMPAQSAIAPLGVLGRENFLQPTARGIGTWTWDPVAQDRARFLPAGTVDAFMFFGPYLNLAPGRYEARFVYRAESQTEAACGLLDIVAGAKLVIGSETMMPRNGILQTARLLFTVEPSELGDGSYEFRVRSSGNSDIYLHAVTCQPIGFEAPEHLDSMGLLRTDPWHEIGQWQLDPAIGRPARYVPAGTKGYVHYGPYQQLSPGPYAATAVLRSTERSDAVALFEVAGKSRTYAAAAIAATDSHVHATRLVFDVEHPDIFEFRVYATGTAELFLYEVRLEAMEQKRAPSLIAAG